MKADLINKKQIGDYYSLTFKIYGFEKYYSPEIVYKYECNIETNDLVYPYFDLYPTKFNL